MLQSLPPPFGKSWLRCLKAFSVFAPSASITLKEGSIDSPSNEVCDRFIVHDITSRKALASGFFVGIVKCCVNRGLTPAG